MSAPIKDWRTRYYEDPRTGCWLWPLALSTQGYGILRHQLVHRVAYQECVGPIPPGYRVIHTCTTRDCLNPAHLALSRGSGPTAFNIDATHCRRGHAFTPENTYVHPKYPHQRHCRRCQADRVRAKRHQERVCA